MVTLLQPHAAHISPFGSPSHPYESKPAMIPIQPPQQPQWQQHRKKTKQEVCDAFLASLQHQQQHAAELEDPRFLESIRQHFSRLPSRYALDVNTEGLDVLTHKRLLDEARSDPSTVSFAVRPVEVVLGKHRDMDGCGSPISTEVSGMDFRGRIPFHFLGPTSITCLRVSGCCSTAVACQNMPVPICVHSSQASNHRHPLSHSMSQSKHIALQKPAFGSSPNLQVCGDWIALARIPSA